VVVINNVLMNSANPITGTLFHKALSSQASHACQSPLTGGVGWDSIQGLKLEAQDLGSKVSSLSSTTISEAEGELEEGSKGGER
jgi:hypothetical protein